MILAGCQQPQFSEEPERRTRDRAPLRDRAAHNRAGRVDQVRGTEVAQYLLTEHVVDRALVVVGRSGNGAVVAFDVGRAAWGSHRRILADRASQSLGPLTKQGCPTLCGPDKAPPP